MATLYLGIDIGTQGAKALVYDSGTKSVVAQGARQYGIIETRVPGRAEQAPSTWIQAGVGAAREALARVDSSLVRAVGVSGQQHGFVALDKDGNVLRDAKLWCDTETAPEAQELSEKIGWTLVPSFTASKILWLKRHEPETYTRMAHVLLPHDYVNFFLTGRYVMECGDASGTGVFDTANRTWDARAMGIIDEQLHTCFPELIGPDEVVGTLTEAAAAALGLSMEVVVAPGSGDNAMSALGSGVSRDGQMVVSLGTSGTIFGKSSTPILDNTCTVCPFCDATGAWLPLVCTMNCTGASEEVCTATGLGHEELTKLAELEPAGCDGLNFLPYLQGERTPNWPGASGALLGAKPGNLRPGLLYRAALEGATFSLLAGLQRMQTQGLQPKEVRLVGGGSKNRLWRQIVADAFQLPVRMPLEPESAALGAALQAGAVHSGISVADYVQEHQPPMAPEAIQPDLLKKKAYEQAFERHTRLGQLLFGNSVGTA